MGKGTGTATVRAIAAACLVLASSTAKGAEAGHVLAAIFSDHAVLQRDKPIPVYGDAAPGAAVTVTLGDARVEVRGDAHGHWHGELPPMPAGGPYTLSAAAAGGATQTLKDILIGDVFLCSGQSNMELQVRSAGFAPLEIRAAVDGAIRYFNVPRRNSPAPLSDLAAPAQWQPASPTTAGNFSAACYFFARELKKTVNVPIGLVSAVWGGTRIREWVSEPGLRALPAFGADLDLLALYRANPEAAQQRWGERWEAWWHSHAGAQDRPWDADAPPQDWVAAPPELGPWASWPGKPADPQGQTEPYVGFAGQMWLRTTVSLSAAQAAMPAVLSLGRLSQEDETWVNGRNVGGTSGDGDALHAIPKSVLHEGVNTVVTNIYCSWKNCGLMGAGSTRALRFSDGSSVPLDPAWRYKAAPVAYGIAPQLPWGLTHGMVGDYNGMIAPLGPYGIRAAIWYQGESNVQYVPEFREALPALMHDWRAIFGPTLPFLIVQLPNYGIVPVEPMESGWSEVREAQRIVANRDGNAALAVTIDIGSVDNLHPPNKQEVGRRLSIAARKLVYGENIAAGPRPRRATRTGDGITIAFDDVSGGLVAYGGIVSAFEACGARGGCRYVDAHIRGNQVVIAGAAKARRVRYCWGDAPTCTLHDKAGLPSSPFEFPVQNAAQSRQD